ncbi:MAG: 3-phosphoshikimate 1-carboxyvinyltransferase [Clostridia bacterium]|nr:3-phosphoshikimate 1-carboxyvinyltransferase [Clostridia bacterium]
MKDMTFAPAEVKGEVRIPSSKSQAHRALICASLAGDSVVRDIDWSNDMEATTSCLRALGAELTYDPATRVVTVTKPCARGIDAGTVSSGESASTLRFFIPLASALGSHTIFTGGGRLPKRPTDLYKPLLEAHGAKLTYPDNGDYLPLDVAGRLEGGVYSLRGDISSQFVTGLLLALSLIDGESRIELTTRLESKPYADLTVETLRTFGGDITEADGGYIIKKANFHPCDYTVEGDCSQAAFFAVAAAINGCVTLHGLRRNTKQGDFALFDIVSRFGADVRWEGNDVTITKARKLRASDIDAADIPDLVPALSVMAACAEGETRIYNAGRLRIKESDRIATTKAMLDSLGAEAYETEDGLRIVGRPKLSGGRVCAFNDHRIAMAAAAASAACDAPVVVDDMSCINKSYPAFVRDLISLIGGVV